MAIVASNLVNTKTQKSKRNRLFYLPFLLNVCFATILDMKKKILVINNSSKISGAELSLLSLLDALRDHYIFIVAIPNEGDFYRELTSLRYKVHCFKMLRFSKKKNILSKFKYFLNLLHTSFKISFYVRKNKIDLIYLNSNQSAVYSILIKLLTKGKIVWHVRDKVNNKLITKVLAHSATAIICVSKYIYDQLPAYKEKKHLVYNGIDTDLWRPHISQKNSNSGKLLVGNVGQLIPWKNHNDLLNVIELVILEIENVHFLIIGDDLFNQNPQYVCQIKESIANKNINEYVSLIGNQKDILNYINQIDILIHCAANEPFGRVVVEAMALQKPVVAYNTGGIKELVVDNRTGFLAPYNDYATLAKKLIILLKNENLRNEFGLQGRQEVEKKFTVNNYTNKIQVLIDKMF